MTYIIVAYQSVPRSKIPHDHLKVEDIAKRFPGTKNGLAIIVARRKDIPDFAESLTSSEWHMDSKNNFGTAAYLVRGCNAYLVWYRSPTKKDGVWVRRPGDV